ncbi:MAG: trigger factor [Elusimicrobiota bacterium]
MVLGLSSNEIKVKVSSEKDCVQTVSVEMPVDKVKEKIEAAFVKVQAQAKIPGFRPGKAPIEIVKEKFLGYAHEEAQDTLLREGVSEAIKIKKIQAVHTPIIQSAKFVPNKPFEFEFQVEVAPTFKVTGHKGIKINKKVKTIGDEDIKKTLENVAQMNAKLTEASTDTLSNTQYAVIDYQGFLDGVALKGAEAKNFLMDMSAPQAIAGLAEGLVGAKVGEEREVKVKFPEDSPAKDLAGKEAVFKVKLQAIKEKKLPIIDEEFAKDLGFENLSALNAKVRENLEKDWKTSSARDVENQIADELLKENSFTVPASLVNDQFEQILKRQRDRMAQQGYGKEEQDNVVDRMKPDAKTQAEKDIRLAYILNAIAEAEKIEATDQDIAAKIEETLNTIDPKDRETLSKAFNGPYHDRLKSELRETKVFEWLSANAKIKEISGGS